MCHVTSSFTNQRRVFKACFTQTERVSDDVTRKIGPLDFTKMVADKLAERNPNAQKCICPNCQPKPKSLGFWLKKCFIGLL